jgi:hypothetical protein
VEDSEKGGSEGDSEEREEEDSEEREEDSMKWKEGKDCKNGGVDG